MHLRGVLRVHDRVDVGLDHLDGEPDQVDRLLQVDDTGQGPRSGAEDGRRDGRASADRELGQLAVPVHEVLDARLHDEPYPRALLGLEVAEPGDVGLHPSRGRRAQRAGGAQERIGRPLARGTRVERHDVAGHSRRLQGAAGGGSPDTIWLTVATFQGVSMRSVEASTVEYVTIHGHRRAYRDGRAGPPLLLLHGIGDHRSWVPLMRPARRASPSSPPTCSATALGQAARRLLGRRLRQRHARPARRCSTSSGPRRRALARRWRRRAVRLPVPRALRTPGAGRRGRRRPGGDAAAAGGHPARRVHPASRCRCPRCTPAARGAARPARATGLPATRDLAEVADDLRLAKRTRRLGRPRRTSCARPSTGAARSSPCATVVPRRRRPGVRSSGARTTRSSRPRTRTSRRSWPRTPGWSRLPNTGHFPHRDHPERFVKVLTDFIRGTAPAEFDPEQWRGHLRRGGDVRIRQAEAGHAPVVPVPRRPHAS